MVVEEFSVYRPILMANISGMEEVLGDRCLQIILSKSGNPKITKKVEIYENDTNIQKIKKFSKGKCRLCRDVALVEMYKAWNEFIDTINVTNVTNITNITNVTNVTNNNIDINKDLFNILNDSGIDGRNLELMFPLIVLAYSIDENILNEVLETLKDIVSEKKREDLVENIDVAVYDFVSQQLIGRWYILKELLKEFKHFSQMEDEWINERWFGKALKRLSLVKDKKKQNYGKLYILDIDKAQEKIKMFKTKDI
jgi:hypothetical protein